MREGRRREGGGDSEGGGGGGKEGETVREGEEEGRRGRQ